MAVRRCDTREPPIDRCGESCRHDRVAEPRLQRLGLVGDRRVDVGPDVLEELHDHLAGRALRPATDDSPVRPHGRTGVAVAVEQHRRMLADVPRTPLPSHRRRIERRQQGDPRLDRSLGCQVVGEHDPGIGLTLEIDGDHVEPGERRTHHADTESRPPDDVAERRRPERRQPATHQLRTSRSDARPVPSASGASVHRCWLLVHEPDGRPRRIRPSAASRLNTRPATPIVAAPALALGVDELGLQLRDPARQLGTGRVSFGERGEGLPFRVAHPSPAVAGDATLLDVVHEPLAESHRDRHGARHMHDRQEIGGDDEHRAPHAQVLHERRRRRARPPRRPGEAGTRALADRKIDAGSVAWSPISDRAANVTSPAADSTAR